MNAARRYDVLTFGETMLRLSPPGFGRLEEAVSLEVRIGGSESNTAVAAARLGLRAAWWSRLPASPLGRRVENEIRRWGVDTSHVLWDPSPDARVGVYFLDFGVPPRGIDVYYDRRGSAFSQLDPDAMDFSPVAQAHLLHLTGITPALGPNLLAVTHRLITAARQSGTYISFDVNYRAKLWTPEQARDTLNVLLPRMDLLLCTQSDAALLFGWHGPGETIARQLRAQFGVRAAVVTCGSEGARAVDDRGEWASYSPDLPHIVDRVGAGDAFNAGALLGFLNNDLQTGLEYGSAMAALKHTMPGDLLLSSRQEIEAVRSGTAHSIRR
ncbi:MAG: sugar kinase [Chloroherpetonaceae bacterium]|nr:sugar kinase [Chthonomonadaceae bacterium]MDW8209229.1 sugar kinase [Chloroherpetonaceae bacterium]